MHHDKYQYENSFIYGLYERKWSRFVNYTKFRSNVASIVLFTGIILLIVGGVLLDKILLDDYILVLIFLLPSCATTILGHKELFFVLDANIINNRVYSRRLPRWVLWSATFFTNLMTVGSASIFLFSITCITLADNVPSEQTVYVEKIEIEDKNNYKIAYVVFEDSTKITIQGIQHRGKDWKEDAYKTILVKNTIFNIRILVE